MSILIFLQIAKYFMMIALGWLIVKVGVLSAKDSEILSKLAVYLILPCAIVHSFQIQATADTLRGLMVSFSAAILIHVVLILAGKIFSRIFRMDGVEDASAIYSNSANMIIPLIAAVLGNEWTLYASAFMSVQTFLLWTHGKAVICGEKGFQWKKIVKNINMIAIFIGILLFVTGTALPSVLDDVFSSIGGMLAPSGMILIGMTLAGVSIRNIFCQRRVYFVCLLRLIVFPLVVLLGIWLAHSYVPMENANTLLFISFIATTTPVSTSVMQIAQVYGKDAEYASAINVMSTLFCLVTMPVLSLLFEMLMPLT